MPEVKTVKKPVAKKTEPKNVIKKSVSEKKDSDNFAVIKTGGKQYVVREGMTYEFEKLEVDEGKEVTFEALLIAEAGNVKIGRPIIAGSKVTGVVVSQFKDEKINVLKYKPKKRYRKNYGHRQLLTKVQIKSIK